MSIEMHARRRWRLALPKFPSQSFVGHEKAERAFGRLLWLLVPLQYYVVTQVAGGLAEEDILPAVALSLISMAVIFVLSCAAAWIASFMSSRDGHPRVALAGRVRMWVVALMISIASCYALLALSFAVTYVASHEFYYQIYGDYFTDRWSVFLAHFGVADETVRLVAPALSNLTYAALATLLVVIARRVRYGRDERSAPLDPGMISVVVIVASVMTVTNWLATLV